MNLGLIEQVAAAATRLENVLLTGMSGTLKGLVLHKLEELLPGKILCLASNDEKCFDLARDLKSYVKPEQVFLFRGRELAFMKENYSLTELERIITLQECLLHPQRGGFIISTPGAFMFPIISSALMLEYGRKFTVGQEIARDDILSALIKCSFKRVDTVTGPGEFAMRGGILDIYPIGDSPCRLEFWGDAIDSIRILDPETQRSKAVHNQVQIFPVDEFCPTDELQSSLLDYLPSQSMIFMDEPRDFFNLYDRNLLRYKQSLQEAEKHEKTVNRLPICLRERLKEEINRFPVFYHSFFGGNIPQVQAGFISHVVQKEMESFVGHYETVFKRIENWRQSGYTVQIADNNKNFRERFQQDLFERNISGVDFIEADIEKGFISQTLQLAVITGEEILGKGFKTSKNKVKKSSGEDRLLLEDLKIGDYVVHENYGIAIFRGVTPVSNDGVISEYILLQFAGTDKLYLPLDKVDLLYRYSANENKEPRLHKLGGSEWERVKKKVAQSVQDMAEELLRIYSIRGTQEGFAFSGDTPWQRQFEEEFPYQATPDQLKAVEDVKKDMEDSKPMDRLICGDVGYGKTEVAMRAAFKAIMDGKQVAVLVPTTILAEQHHRSLKERFGSYPTTIEVLSRFRTSAQQKVIIANLRKGLIDIVVGTHRIISSDVAFKDLGLLIIDEEHRFGVAQKEKIKALKETVDVISLSATPIPRSLHMSMTGLRDMTVIETPPPERYPIATYVLEYNEEIIVDAINNELERGGQVFFVHNRIKDIYRVRDELSRLLPRTRIAVGHGKMSEQELSQVMLDFINGGYDIFLCTTIIESGLDIPNVNTLIVDEADKMGLAQLYQLRGRIGRSSRMAYAYLTYRPYRNINETAQKRLNAIREFNELGSGLKIALRDLEIRGAGNILGAEQHGFIYAVGFDLYCSLLEQEAARLKGVSAKKEIAPQFDLDVDYYIPDSYIPDTGTKFRLYRRILLAADNKEIEEIRQEILDRFGPMPLPVENFLQIAWLRIAAASKQITGLRRQGKTVEIQLGHRLPTDLSVLGLKFAARRVNDNTLAFRLDRNVLSELHTLINSL